MLHQVVQDVQELDVWILALVLTCVSEREVHEQSCCVLDAIIREVFSLVLQQEGDPLDHVQLDHYRLGLPPQRELLEGTQGILTELGVALLFLEDLDESLHQVLSLEQVASARLLVTDCVDKSHRVLEHLSVRVLEKHVDDLPGLP